MIKQQIISSSNPRTREGCDSSCDAIEHSGGNFNPRTSEGCDTEEWLRETGQLDFNPRTHERCDEKKIKRKHLTS
nr:hypothetical protein [uncultured Peptoniphilus sp.]